MLRTRLWMGALLILLVVGVLFSDPAPYFPLLLVLALLASLLSCHELLGLLPEPRPRAWVCYLGVAGLILANWPAHLITLMPNPPVRLLDPWHWLLGVAVLGLLLAFLIEGMSFRGPGGAVARISAAFWIMGYLGLLAGYLLQLRWLTGGQGALALALAIFVPKCCDIGAYFSGRFLGRHPMAPILSPKKTWEGAAGGLALAAAVAVALNHLGKTGDAQLLSPLSAVGFGLVVGAAGMIGDLMESLIKRDCERKDASQVVPGFGGVLDVLDSILFAAPVAYLWLVANR